MPSFQELRDMYDRGQIDEVLTAINGMMFSCKTEEGKPLQTLQGWCHYRRKDFRQARNCAVGVENYPWARELMAYLYAYAPGYINDKGLRQIAEELGSSNINIAIAFVIRARSKDAMLTKTQVVQFADRFKNETTTNAANLMHNVGRFFLDKHQGNEDLEIAVNYLDDAINRYGMDKNFHHRAAANFWKSQAQEKRGNLLQTIDAAQESVRLWDEQCKLDPTNEGFAKNGENAKKHLGELIAKQDS